jgi:hypothetical protein
VWVDGRIVGGWAQRRDGKVVVELLEPVASAARDGIGAAAARLEEWFAGTAVTPRFRTPTERRLAAS